MTIIPDSEPSFGIGSVSRLTGIPVDTLRVWERRYDLVTPTRSPDNKRCYSRADIERLVLVKQLVDQGHAIGSVAHLSEEALKERLHVYAETAPRLAVTCEKLSVLVYGEALPFLVESWAGDLPTLNVVGRHATYADFEKDALDKKPDVLVVEWPALKPESAVRLRDLAQCAAVRRAVVVYGFGATEVLDRVQQMGLATLRAPVTARALEAACRLDSGANATPVVPPSVDEALPPRLFDSETMAAIANVETKVRCECPHHLADLVFRLSAFEAYSADCENRNEQDAALHAHLHRTAAQARALMEKALDFLIVVEGIDLKAMRQGEDPADAVAGSAADS